MKGSTRPRQLIRLFPLAALSVGLLLAACPAQATEPGTVVAWGCGGAPTFECGVPSDLSHVTAIAAGGLYSLALKGDGSVVAWPCANVVPAFGQCNVPSGPSDVAAIAAGAFHGLALKSDGSVVAWGCGDPSVNFGQCNVPSGLSGVTAIATSLYHSLALKIDGTVVPWGCGFPTDSGQCSVPSGLTGVTAIAAGAYHSLALKGDGSVVAWGCGAINNVGQCTVPSDLSGVTAIAAGFSHSLALKGDGTVVGWGCEGSADHAQCSVPSGLSGVTAIAAGFYHSLALKSDGSVVAWGCVGFPDRGQCSVPTGLCQATAISAGSGHSLATAKICQTITFGALATRTFGDPDFEVSASASSGLPVSFAASGSCTIGGTIVHITSAGSCTLTASQPGDAVHVAASEVSQAFTIAKAAQSITFSPLAGKTHGDPEFVVLASASSGLTVSFAAGGNCTVSGSTVHLTGAGSCTVTASQPGNANYTAALDVSRTFAISKAGQSISFATLGSKTYGAPDFQLTVTASSGLRVALTATGSCRVTGATVHLTGVGTCTLTASQPGDVNYEAAPNVSRTFSIARRPCKVPKVVGKRLASARLMIATGHCRTGKVSYAYSQRVKGIVISQSRRAARVLPAGSRIDLLVSRGPRPKRR
jgi:Regulator of chromosome condensation (RCC1) repeat